MTQEGTRQRPRSCTATRQDGKPCRAWAVPTLEPPRCGAHGGGQAPPGAPKGNTNARKHGFYAGKPGFYAEDPSEVTIDDAIAGLVDKLRLVDDLLPTIDDLEHAPHQAQLQDQYDNSHIGRTPTYPEDAFYPAEPKVLQASARRLPQIDARCIKRPS